MPNSISLTKVAALEEGGERTKDSQRLSVTEEKHWHRGPQTVQCERALMSRAAKKNETTILSQGCHNPYRLTSQIGQSCAYNNSGLAVP